MDGRSEFSVEGGSIGTFRLGEYSDVVVEFCGGFVSVLGVAGEGGEGAEDVVVFMVFLGVAFVARAQLRAVQAAEGRGHAEARRGLCPFRDAFVGDVRGIL